jgi:hypothetical protein
VTFARFKETGSGRLNFRLEIAGWPHEWTTHTSITHNTGRDQREVFPGLQYTGLKISEKAILKDCWSQCGQLTVKIKPTTTREETLDSFTRTAVPVAYLAQHDDTPGLDADSTFWTLDGASDLPVGFYHIASEAIYRGGSGELIRARWSTTAQRHYIAYGSTSAISVPIYAYPPTMEGRRAALYAYGEGDDGGGDGTVIWRGIVARPPALDGDGVTWTIQIDPIIKSLEQNVAASESLEYHVRGIYHSSNCPVRITYRRFGSPYDVTNLGGENAVITGFFASDEDLERVINTKIADLITQRDAELTGHTSEIATATYHANSDIGVPTITGETSTSIAHDVLVANDGSNPLTTTVYAFGAAFHVESYLEGYCTSGVGSGMLTNVAGRVGGPFGFVNYNVGASDTFIEYFGDDKHEFATPLGTEQPQTPVFTYPLSPARAMLGSVPYFGLPVTASDPLNPPDVLYLDLVDGIQAGDTLLVKNGDKLIPISVSAVDADNRAINASILSGDAVIWFDANTQIIPLRVFAQDTTMADFLQGVEDSAVNANDGDSPYVPPGDVNVSSFQAAYSAATIDTYWKHRTYAFQKPTPIKRVVQEELKAIGFMTRIEANGEVGCVPLPLLAQNRSSTPLTDKDILLPARGMTGDWIRWQAQADGLVNNTNVRLGYNPGTDDYDPQFDYSVRSISSIAEHKTNGTKGAGEIAPVSTPAQRDSPLRDAMTGSGPSQSPVSTTTPQNAPSPTRIATWVENYMRVLSMDYATVTVKVPFTFFDVLVGDVLNVTCAMIPNGLGKRGVTSKKAAVIGRDWNLDPAHNDMGTLTLYFPREVSSGYAPSGHITSQSNVSGNIWDVSCSAADDLNMRMSEEGDGDVHRHFGVSDKILIVQRDAGLIPLNVKGSVVSSGPSAIRVSLDAAWTPGTDDWLIEFQIDDGTLSTHQKGFTFVADTLKQLRDGSVARRYL